VPHLESHIPDMPTIFYFSERGGRLSRISPWSKLLLLLFFVVSVTVIQSLVIVLLLYALTLSLYAAGGLPLRRLFGWSILPAVFVLTISILFIFSQGGTPVLVVPGLFTITDGGIFLVIKLLLKGLTVVNFSLAFIMSTKYAEISALADKVLPRPLDVVFLLTFRFVFITFEVINDLLTAAWARGGSLLKGVPKMASLYAKVFGIGVIYSFDKAERVGKAMEARGFSGELRSYGSLRPPSLLELAAIATAFCAVIVLAYLVVIP